MPPRHVEEQQQESEKKIAILNVGSTLTNSKINKLQVGFKKLYLSYVNQATCNTQ